MRVIVFGSRNYKWYYTIKARLAKLPEGTVIVHGDCPTGADNLADEAARELGFPVERHPALWEVYGRRAGPIRNEETALLGADLAIGFRSRGKSNGTDDMARRCANHRIPVEMHMATIAHDPDAYD